MLSRVSLCGPGGTGVGAVAPIPACGIVVLDDPGTAVESSPCAGRTDSELSALPLISPTIANREELEQIGGSFSAAFLSLNHFMMKSMKGTFFKCAVGDNKRQKTLR